MIKYGKELIEIKTQKEFTCDRCKNTISNDMELQETYSIRFVGGYNSVFGDCRNVACDLCQYCLYDLINGFCIYNDEDKDEDE